MSLEKLVKKTISALPEQELLIGQAIVLPTDDSVIPYIIIAPTMRVPMSFNISTSVNAYLAMKAILLAAQKNSFKKVAIPSLCTGVGKMDPEISANQMHIAYKEVVLGIKRPICDFGDAQKHQLELIHKTMIWDY